MKKIGTLLFLLCLQLSAWAQDRIVLLSGEEFTARILEITLDEVHYQHPDSLEGKLHRVPKAELFMVQFSNGAKEVFARQSEEVQLDAYAGQDLYRLGQEDARRYYKGTGAFWGSVASSVTLFPLGLAGSAIIGMVPPKATEKSVPDITLLQHQDYTSGYTIEAHRKKRGKALAGAGLGIAAQLALIMILISSAY